MGFFDRMEGKLERAYNGVFAKAFRAEVQPVEIASAIRRAMDDKAAVVGKGVALVPNVFTIELSETDYERLGEFSDDLSDELIAAAEEHVDSQHYRPSGPLRISLVEDVDLETGVFRVRPASAKRPDATGYTGQQPAVPYPDSEWDGDDEGYEDDDEADDQGYAASVFGEPDDDAPYEDNAADEDDDDQYSDDGPNAAAPPPVAPPPVAPTSRSSPRPQPRVQERPQPRPTAHPIAGRAVQPPAPPPTPVAPNPPAAPRKIKPADRPWFDIDGDRYLLVSARNVIGRDETADVGLDDPGISRRHAEVRVTIDGPHFVAAIRDLGSTNGTFVNGDRITTTHLQDGDRITVGRTTMIYRVRR